MNAVSELLSAELAGLAVVTLLAGLVRGFTGFGAGLLMAPWVLMILGPSRAVPVLGALELVASIRLVPSALREIDARASISLALPACLAVPLGSLLLVGLDPGPEVGRVMKMLLEHRIENGPYDVDEAHRLLDDWKRAGG